MYSPLGKGPKNVKLRSLTIEKGVGQNHTPYCKVYTQRKYTLFDGKTMVKNKIHNKKTTLKHRGGVVELWWRTTLLHFFLGGPFPNCLYILKHVYFMSLKNKDIILTCIKIAFTCRVFKKSEICGSNAFKIWKYSYSYLTCVYGIKSIFFKYKFFIGNYKCRSFRNHWENWKIKFLMPWNLVC